MKTTRFLTVCMLFLMVLAACGQSAPTTSGASTTVTAPTTVAEAPTAAPATTAPEAPIATSSPAETSTSAEQPTTGESTIDTAKLSKELHFYNWSDYIDTTTLDDFKAKYGVTVIMDTYDTNEDMLAKIRPGHSGYDVVVPSDYAVDIMVKEGLAAKLDKAQLPNLQHISTDYLNLYYDPNNDYSVPYFVGTTGIAYNKNSFPTPPDSWAALFDPAQLEKYKGKVSMLDDEREAIGAALIYLGKSLNDTDPNDLKAAEDLLTKQKPFLASYNSSDFNRKLASEEIVIAHAWNGSAGQAYTGLDDFPGNTDIGFVIPKEGGTIWQDNLMVVGDSPNKYTAEVFINYLLDPQVGAKNTDYVLFSTPNIDAEKLIDEKTQAVFEAGFGPPKGDIIKRLEWIKRSDANNTIFSDIWTRIKSS